jgi:hypothetical protein
VTSDVARHADVWEGFEPTGYELNFRVLKDFALFEIAGENRNVPTDVGALLREVLPHWFYDGERPPRLRCRVESFAGVMTIETPQRTIQLNTLGNSSSFPAELLEVLLRIDDGSSSDGPFHPIFFYYDKDRVTDDDHDSFGFFVVNGDRIVLDRVTFSRHSNSGFNPNVFSQPFQTSRSVWRNEPFVEAAKVRWWYRKFYKETPAGELTTLREDVSLYHYVPEWKQHEQFALSSRNIERHLVATQRLLFFVLVALLLIAYLLWK